MEFRIADTFVDSLSKLTNQEQKAVKTTVFDLQVNPANPGLKFHKLDGARDPRFVSVRVNLDIRLIVHQSQESLLVCYVDHHDNAYQWARRRKLETHPTTGAAQLVEVRETVQEIVIPSYVPGTRQKPKLFEDISDDKLLGFGVPPEWLKGVRDANEDNVLELAEHLPVEAAEALLELATGGTPVVAEIAAPITSPFDHPDALRRFRIMSEAEDLESALEYPWEKWTVFLHPMQQQIVSANYPGPARVYGSAGTGKTVVALHRAVYLAKNNPDDRVLLATFSDTLANALQTKLRRLLYNQPKLGEQIEVYAMDAIGERLLDTQTGKASMALADVFFLKIQSTPDATRLVLETLDKTLVKAQLQDSSITVQPLVSTPVTEWNLGINGDLLVQFSEGGTFQLLDAQGKAIETMGLMGQYQAQAMQASGATKIIAVDW